MPEHALHPDLGAGAVDGLEPDERRALDEHLAACPECRERSERLRAVAALAREADAPLALPPGMEARVLGAVFASGADARAGAGAGAATPLAPPRRRRLAPRAVVAGLAAAAVLVAGTVVAVRSLDDGPAGTLEVSATLRSPSDAAVSAAVTVRNTGLGRTVVIRSDTLPVLPKGEFYEVWFVGPTDTPADPDRISAGTFHPDDAGRTDITLHAAADPALFPVLSVTHELADGDPRPGERVVSATRRPPG